MGAGQGEGGGGGGGMRFACPTRRTTDVGWWLGSGRGGAEGVRGGGVASAIAKLVFRLRRASSFPYVRDGEPYRVVFLTRTESNEAFFCTYGHVISRTLFLGQEFDPRDSFCFPLFLWKFEILNFYILFLLLKLLPCHSNPKS